jgi:D-alanyl-D-alanine carboxypeptidase (penicillin-binding protein 5/6)
LAALLIAVSAWNYVQPPPTVAAASTGLDQYVITGTAPSLPWPATGSGAVGVSDLGLIATSGDVAPAPAASVAKVMTALVLLVDKPLDRGQAGPTLIITDQDVETYMADAAQQQSVVPVTAGEQLNEFEALEALLVPSGNNIAETLARWDAGSVSAFVAKMNERAAALHLTHTTFRDPAGVSLATVSTAADLVTLGMAAMQQAVLAQIVSLPQTTLPVAGIVYNVNGVLGQNGIVGIKTGVNAGANFLFAAAATIDGHALTLYGCVMGQPTLDSAFNAAEALIVTMENAVKVRPIVSRNDAVGVYETAWGSRSDLVATQDLTLVEWPGMTLREKLDAQTLAVDRPVAGGLPAGTLHVALGDQQADVPLVTAGSLDPPGVTWRLWRINF